jgi:hypothetical protein
MRTAISIPGAILYEGDRLGTDANAVASVAARKTLAKQTWEKAIP